MSKFHNYFSTAEIARIQKLTDDGVQARMIAQLVSMEFGRFVPRRSINNLWYRGRVHNPTSGKERQGRGGKYGGQAISIRGKRGLLKRNGCWGEYDPTPPQAIAANPDDAKLSGVEYLENEGCKFVLGDRKDSRGLALSCGQERIAESSYCAAHHARCYTPVVRKANPRPFILRSAA